VGPLTLPPPSLGCPCRDGCHLETPESAAVGSSDTSAHGTDLRLAGLRCQTPFLRRLGWSKTRSQTSSGQWRSDFKWSKRRRVGLCRGDLGKRWLSSDSSGSSDALHGSPPGRTPPAQRDWSRDPGSHVPFHQWRFSQVVIFAAESQHGENELGSPCRFG